MEKWFDPQISNYPIMTPIIQMSLLRLTTLASIAVIFYGRREKVYCKLALVLIDRARLRRLQTLR